MTVEELLQKLVDLAREGKGQYEVTRGDSDWCEVELDAVVIQDDKKLIELV